MPSDPVPFKHSWPEVPMWQHAAVTVGGTPSTAIASFWGGGTVRWMSSGDVHLKRIHDVSGRITERGLLNSAARVVAPPCVAVALAGQGKTRGTVALTLIPLSTNQSVALIKPDDKELSASYLFHDLDFRYEELRSRSLGGGRAGLTKTVVEGIPVPLPDYDEQTAIASVLDTVDDAIQQTAAVIEKLKKIKTGLLHDLLTRGIGADGQLRNPVHHPEQFKDSPLGKVPKVWEVLRVVETCDILDNQRIPVSAEHRHDRCGTIPYYGATGQQGWMDRWLFDEELILLAEDGGDFNSYATTPIAYRISGKSWVNNHVHVLRANPQYGTSYVFHCLEHRDIRYYIRGGTRTKLNKGELQQIELPIASEDERQTIAGILDTHDDRIRAEEATLRKLGFIKQGLMQDLLTGRVRVPTRLWAKGVPE